MDNSNLLPNMPVTESILKNTPDEIIEECLEKIIEKYRKENDLS